MKHHLLLTALVIVFGATAWSGCGSGGSGGGGGGGGGDDTPRYALGGTVNGMPAGQSLTLSDGHSEARVDATGAFVFDEKLPSGTPYRVVLRSGPAERYCVVSNGIGTVDDSDVDDVLVDCSRIRNWVPDHVVLAMALSPDATRLYVGGDFTRVGLPTGNATLLERSTGAADLVFARVDGTLRTAIADGSGGWYLGGQFTGVNDKAVGNIVHALADRSVDERFDASAFSGIYQTVEALALSGNTLLVASGARLVGIDATTGVLLPWSFTVDGRVTTLSANDSMFFAGGEFRHVNGRLRNALAAFDAQTGQLAAWNPAPTLAGQAASRIDAMAASGSTLFISGNFDTIAGAARHGLAAIDGTTGEASAWNPHCEGTAQAIAVAEATVYLAGDLASVGGASRATLAAVDAVTGAVSPWDPRIPLQSPPRFTLAATGDTVYVTGAFDMVGDVPRSGVAAIDAKTAQTRNWGPDLARLDGLFLSGDDLVAAGSAPFAAGKARVGIAAISATSGALLDWNPRLALTHPWRRATVNALLVDGSTIVAGGLFDHADGLPRKSLAFIDAVSGQADPSKPVLPEIDSAELYSIALSGRTLYFAGLFEMGGHQESRVLALDAMTGLLTPWRPDATDAWISAVAVRDSMVYVGGYFEHVGNTSRKYLAAFDAATAELEDWTVELTGDNIGPELIGVNTFKIAGATVFAGGSFSGVGDRSWSYIAALDAITGAPSAAWDDSLSSHFEINDIALAGDQLFAGGVISGDDGGGLAVHDAATGALVASKETAGDRGGVFAVAMSDLTLFMGGLFHTVDGTWQPNLVFIGR